MLTSQNDEMNVELWCARLKHVNERGIALIK